MMNIEEEIPPEHTDEPSHSGSVPMSGSRAGGTPPQLTSRNSGDDSTHRLPRHISELLDKLEREEETERSESRNEDDGSSQSDEERSLEEFVTPEDVGQEVDKALNVSPVSRQSYSSKDDDPDLKSWGQTGLEGLKSIFKPSHQSGSSTSKSSKALPENSPPACSIVASASDSTTNCENHQKSSSVDPPSSKSTHKKSVTFAPETYLSPPKPTSKLASVPEALQPAPGIVLSDVVERPMSLPTAPAHILSSQVNLPNEKQVNGKNAHLNPRLASLLPRSLQNSTCSNDNQTAESLSAQQQDSENCENSTDGEYDDDVDQTDDDKSSTWSYDDDEGAEDGSSWPPQDLDIQTALDLRQAALAYHSQRQGLGLGSGTGPLGGDKPPGSDDDVEWVPVDARVQAPGVPRPLNGQSRFKAGRSLPIWNGANLSCLGDEKVVDGKLFGTAPILDGPAPTKGAAVHTLPGRAADFTELDDELTTEELELLRSRLEVIGMDEESRIAAERAGSDLMAWMEKARKGEVELDGNYQDESRAGTFHTSTDQLEKPPSIHPSCLNNAPPNIKTAPKGGKISSRRPGPQNSSALASASPSDSADLSQSEYLESSSIPLSSSSTGVQQARQPSAENKPCPAISADSLKVSEQVAQTAPKKLSRFKASKLNPNQ